MNIGVLATNLEQTEEVRQEVWSRAGPDPRIVYVSLAKPPEERQQDFQQFKGWYDNSPYVTCISNCSSDDNQALIKSATVICMGYGYVEMLADEMARDGLVDVLLQTIKKPANLRLLMGISAGTVYVSEGFIHPMIDTGNGELEAFAEQGEFDSFEVKEQLGLLERSYFVVHANNPQMRTDECLHRFPSNGSIVYALYENSALLFENGYVRKIGNGKVRVGSGDGVCEL